MDAFDGFTHNLTHLNGHVVKVKSGPCKPGDKITIVNEGMPISKIPGKKGNLVVVVNVVLPNLNSSQIEELRKILK